MYWVGCINEPHKRGKILAHLKSLQVDIFYLLKVYQKYESMYDGFQMSQEENIPFTQKTPKKPNPGVDMYLKPS